MGQEKPFAVVAPPLEEAVRCPLLDRNPEAWLRCCTARFLPSPGGSPAMLRRHLVQHLGARTRFE